MSLFKIIQDEQNQVYLNAGIRNETMQHSFRWWDLDVKTVGKSVTFLDEFQSLADFQNDLVALWIKPLTCHFMSWYHAQRFLYELILTAAHLLTLNPRAASKHFRQSVISFVSIYYFYLQVFAEIFCQILSFATRCVVTVVYGLFQFGAAIANLLSPHKVTTLKVEKKPRPKIEASYDPLETISKEQRVWYEQAGLRTELMSRNHWWDAKTNAIDKPVGSFDQFQSLADFQNDLLSLVAKPLTCYFLSSYHFARCSYELTLGFIHLFTLNPQEAYQHFEQAITSLISAVYYCVDSLVEVIKQTLSLTTRCVVTLGYGVYQAGAAVSAGFFSDSKGRSSSTDKSPGFNAPGMAAV